MTSNLRRPTLERALRSAFAPFQPAGLLKLRRWIRYLVPLGAAVLVYLVQLCVLAQASISPFIFFPLAVALSAWVGGRGPGLLAVLLSTVLTQQLWLGSNGWSLSRPEVTEAGLFALNAFVVALICAAFRGAALRAHQLAEERARLGNETLQKEERFRAIFEGAALGIIEGDAEGRLENVNQRFCQMLGYAREELVGVSAHELTAPQDRVQARDFNDRLLRGEIDRYDYDKRYIAKNGTPVWVHVTVSGVRDSSGVVRRVVATVEDITQLRQAKARLEEVDARKNEFLAVLSHELRNPLAPIRNSLYVLERVPPGGQQAKRAHQVIDRQVVHLTRLVDDLLDVTRITRGKVRLQRERVELGDLVVRTAEDHRSLFMAAEVDLQTRAWREPLYTDGDATRLSQVIGNLLTNAAKFTPRGGHVELWVAPEDGAGAIHVRDNGVGIAPSLASKLFMPFVQADSTLDRSKGGLGLGLALVKGLVELHGGTVSARSEGAGQGTEFIVRLPLEQVSESGETRCAWAQPQSRSLRVLVIEDNLDAAESLKTALELNGHRVEIARTGLEGIDKAHARLPEVVLCDIGLPGMDGFEVARRMRSDPALRAACLVALSGYAGPEDLERSKEAGFAQHLAKPPNLVALESTLFTALGDAARGL